MYFRDFNPQNYNQNIYLADLCIDNIACIANSALLDIVCVEQLNHPSIVFTFDITHMSADEVHNMCVISQREKSFKTLNTKILGKNMYLILSFYVKDDCIPEYRVRSKYGLKYAGKTELIQFCSFWNGYLNFIPTKKAAARESSRLYFLFFHYLFHIVISTILCTISLLY